MRVSEKFLFMLNLQKDKEVPSHGLVPQSPEMPASIWKKLQAGGLALREEQ